MDYIAGIPIDRYASEHGMMLNDRLILFKKVCMAVQYAHQHLVIHRDIKPSNILVISNGEPVLLDFGIAKLLTIDAEQGTRLTKLEGHRPMTPSYASPEQLAGGVITTASDVYSLGVVLFELLTGQLPTGRQTSGPDSAAGEVGDYKTPTPSSVLAECAGKIDGVPTTRSKWIPRLLFRNGNGRRKTSVPDDVDQIVLMALRPEPERRYASTQRLSDDIEKYTRGLPVLAHADSFGYRASKFVRRNKMAIVTAAGLLFRLFQPASVTKSSCHG